MTNSTVAIVLCALLIAAPNVYNIWMLLKNRSEQKKQDNLQPLLGVVLPKDKKEK
jgi:hypothetical protein